MLNKFSLLLAIFFTFLCLSCISFVEDIGYLSILGYNQETIANNMKTLDPVASYSKRSSVLVTLMGDNDKAEELSEKYASLINSVLLSDRINTVKTNLVSDEVYIDLYLVYPTITRYSAGLKFPVILFAHGGGFTGQDYSVYESLTKNLAEATQSVVLFYEYRLAPEYKYPAAVHDTYNVYKWLKNSEIAECFRLDNQNVVFFGDSSGGTLIEGLSLRLAEEGEKKPNGIVLIYPCLDLTDRLNFSKIAFSGMDDKKRYFVTSLDYLSWVKKMYLEKPSDAYERYASPLIMLEGLIDVDGFDNPMSKYKLKLTPPLDLPEHYIAVAQVDSLRDEGKTYNALLNTFGVKSKCKEYSGMFHGFLMASSFLSKARECFDDIVEIINRWLNTKQRISEYSHIGEEFYVSTSPFSN